MALLFKYRRVNSSWEQHDELGRCWTFGRSPTIRALMSERLATGHAEM